MLQTTVDKRRIRRGDLYTLFPLPQRKWRRVADALNLTDRELEVIQDLFNGGTEETIARRLDLSSHTIHSHFGRLYRKLQVRDRCGLAIRVFAEYLSIEPPGDDHETACEDEGLSPENATRL